VPKTFLDTNILAYAADRHDAARRHAAADALRRLAAACDLAVVSTQVLQELYVTAVRKLHIEPAPARALIASLRWAEIVLVDAELILEAADLSAAARLSFWDALIVSAARKAGCTRLWSEVLSDGRTIAGVRIENPLKTPGAGTVREGSPGYGRPRQSRRLRAGAVGKA